MQFLKLTTDKLVKRLRWIMVGVIVFDNINTLLGQPGRYWQHPATADEGNHLTHLFISRGYLAFGLYELVYTAAAFILASIVPRQVALVVTFSFILGHYYGASTWLNNRWNFGTQGTVIYGIILAVILVQSAFPPPRRLNDGGGHQKPDNSV